MFEFGAYNVSNMCQRTLRVTVAVVNMMSKAGGSPRIATLSEPPFFISAAGAAVSAPLASDGWVGATVAAGAAGRQAAASGRTAPATLIAATFFNSRRREIG